MSQCPPLSGTVAAAAPVPYAKPWLSWSDQVSRLQSRGLSVRDRADAEDFLSHINYYRFTGYCAAFQSDQKQFYPGTTFQQVRRAYEFDCELRDLVFEALEFVEVDVRTSIAHHFGQAYGPFGHTKPSTFYCCKQFDHARWRARLHDEAERSSEAFVDHFKQKYEEYPDLPVWVVTEIVSFTALSKMFAGMHRADQRAIASRYGVQPKVFGSWFHHLVYVRNLCAHHCRIWDRVWAVKPELPMGKHWQAMTNLKGNRRLFATLLILYHIKKCCRGIAPAPTAWRDDLHDVLRTPPPAPKALTLLGLPADWEQHPLWE